ncbi:MAG TPA: DUF72 domain-containing protein [bacterium]|nr:DUF72 domain-containing protein [bacterium]
MAGTISFDFRHVPKGVHFATASDRYASWVGQIYSADQGYKITKSRKQIKGEAFVEEKLPVRSVSEYFAHYGALEIDFTFYDFLLDREGNPSRNWAPLAEYAKYIPDDGMVVLKVPEGICATTRWNFAGGKRTAMANDTYLDPDAFTKRFYRPATEILGNRIAAFSFEKAYQRKDSCPPPEKNIESLREFFEAIPRDPRYHIEERTDRLKTEDYFVFLHEYGIGNVFSHWTWLPDLKRQWEQAGGFTGSSVIIRLLTPLRVAYEESYARYHPFAELRDEIPSMYRDAAFLIREGLSIGLPVIHVANNRAGGNANLINRRVLDELELLLEDR